MENGGFSKEKLWLGWAIGILLCVMVLDRIATTYADLDLWGYLAFGKRFWTTGEFPYHDIFSYAPTLKNWIYHEWLTGVIFYPLYQTLGAAGLQILKYVAVLGALGLVYLAARQQGAQSWAAALGVYLIYGLLRLSLSPVRAQTFTILFFALTLYLLERARQGGNWRVLWFLLPVQMLWCNFHGGFVAGLGLTGLYAVGEAVSIRRFLPYASIMTLSGLVALINPYGLEYWCYLLRAITMSRPTIGEWYSVYKAVQTGNSMEAVYYLFVVTIIAGSLFWWCRWREVTSSLCLAATLCLSLLHLRHVVFFLLLVGAYLPMAMTSCLPAAEPNQWLRQTSRLEKNIGACMIILLIGIYGYNFLRQAPLSLKTPPIPGRYPVYYPIGAVRVIKKYHLHGDLLNDFNWGEYLIWTLYPQCRVAIDGRYETVYPQPYSRRAINFFGGGKGWRQFLEQNHPDMILVNTRSRIYPKLLRTSWRQIYADSGCALFLRADEISCLPSN